MKSKAVLLAGSVLACVGLALSCGGRAAAGEPGQDNTSKPAAEPAPLGSSELDEFVEEMGDDFLDNQSALSDLKTWILDQPEAPESGYINQINYAESRSVRLLWYQSDPFLLRVLAQAKTLGIAASVEQRSMSLSQIDEAMQRIWDQAGDIAEQGFVIRSIAGVGMADTGLDVEGVYTGDLATESARNTAKQVQQARQALADSVAALAGARVGLIEVDSENAAPRSTDTSPFRAGDHA